VAFWLTKWAWEVKKGNVSWFVERPSHMRLFLYVLYVCIVQGKTIQAIATILDNRPKFQHSKPGMKHPPSAPDLDDRIREEGPWKDSLASWHHEMEMVNVPKKPFPRPPGTDSVVELVWVPWWFVPSLPCINGGKRSKNLPRTRP
jgi:hypothetical protein